jgi:hypothetical protein
MSSVGFDFLANFKNPDPDLPIITIYALMTVSNCSVFSNEYK